MPTVSALEKRRLEDQEFKASLGYVTHPQNNNNNEKNGEFVFLLT
jgi:hypothetical protein